jgi:PhnB protein
MIKVNPYLNFDGNCREAFDFYAETLGGEIQYAGTFGEMPEGEVPDENSEGCANPADWPDGWQDKIMHISMQLGNVTLMGSDAPAQYARPQGINVSLNVETVEEAERLYAVLSEGGEVQMPIAETFWARRFAMFTDRFGTPWMINCEKPME